MRQTPANQIEHLGISDASRILELINHIQPSIPWTMEHLNWQFFLNPAGEAKLYGISDSGKLISFYAAVPHTISNQSRIIRGRMIQDVMTHPDYRGRGFLHQLAKHCMGDMIANGEIGYTFPNENSENSFRRTGWSALCRVPWRKKHLDSLLSSASIISTFAPIVDFSAVPDIWSFSLLPLGVDRNPKYLGWRYSKPGTCYSSFVVNRDQAILILKTYEDAGRRVLHICELFTSRECLHLIPEMLTFSELFAADRGADVLTAWLPEGHPYAAAFDTTGLNLSPDSSRYVFAHSGGSGMDISDYSLWHITQGDSDIY